MNKKILTISLVLILGAVLLLGAGCVKKEAVTPTPPTNEAGVIPKEEVAPVVEEEEAPVVEETMPVITFTVKDPGNCPGCYPVFNILRDGKVIGEVKSPKYEIYTGHELRALRVIAQNKDYSYFSISPDSGLGGWIMAGITGSLYQIDLSNNKISKIAGETSWVGELTFTPDLRKLFYNQHGEGGMRLVALPNNTITRKYSYPESYRDGGQFGNFKFSPQEDKIAFVGILGPADEKSAVFILSLSDGSFKLVEEKLGKIFTVKGWIDNETVSYE